MPECEKTVVSDIRWNRCGRDDLKPIQGPRGLSGVFSGQRYGVECCERHVERTGERGECRRCFGRQIVRRGAGQLKSRPAKRRRRSGGLWREFLEAGDRQPTAILRRFRRQFRGERRATAFEGEATGIAATDEQLRRFVESTPRGNLRAAVERCHENPSGRGRNRRDAVKIRRTSKQRFGEQW